MKKKWLISVEGDALQKVVNALKNKGVNVLEVLKAIRVIIVDPDDLNISEIKKIDGIINIEIERGVSI